MRRPIRLLLALLLGVSLIPPAARPAAAQGAGLAATPSALALTLAPGEQRSAVIQIRNTSGAPVSLMSYEAYPEGPARARALGPLRASVPSPPARIDSQIAERAAAAPDQRADMIIFLNDQADLRAALAIDDWGARGAFVYQTLTAHAARTQAGLRRSLEAAGTAYQPLWIVNAIRLTGTPAEAAALAARPEVAAVMADQSAPLPSTQEALVDLRQCSPDDPGNPICWNVRAINADRVWSELGVDGQGVTVATIDTGALFTHPALAAGYRGSLGGGVFDHRHSWYDPQRAEPQPADPVGHGTHVLGTLVGRGAGTAEQPAIGVAPGASWIAAQGCGTNACSEGDLIAAAQWLLAPTDMEGRDPRPDLRPMIVNNSWGGQGGADWYDGYLAAWRAAGIFPVFAAGNNAGLGRAACGSVAAPGDDAQVFTVGATDMLGAVTPFSLRGPGPGGVLKPDLVAPGTYLVGQFGVYSAASQGAQLYRTLQGTSMAAPHVAGAVALLWSANPALIGDYDATAALLRATARPIPDTTCGEQQPVPNRSAGYGQLDAHAAVARATVDLPWLALSLGSAPLEPGATRDLTITVAAARLPSPGTYQARAQIYPGDLSHAPISIPISVTIPDDGGFVSVSGVVTAADRGTPLLAQVGVVGGLLIATDAQGRYQLRLRPGTVALVAQAASYQRATRSLSIGAGGLVADFALQPDQPRMVAQILGPPVVPTIGPPAQARLQISNTGTRPLQYQIYTIPEVYGIWRSDEPDGPTPGLLDLPLTTSALALSPQGIVALPLDFSFPIYGRSFDQIYIGANGVVSFIEPVIGSPPLDLCHTDRQIYQFAVAPFRTNLDLARGGQVRAAQVDADTFVVSYEAIPLSGQPGAETYSFQVVLTVDGRITFRYGALGALPSQLLVGVQRIPGDQMTVACGRDGLITPGLAIELRPQASSALWLPDTGLTGSVPAGSTTERALTVGWLAPMRWPYRGRVQLLSSDPFQSAVILQIESRPQPAPYRMILPLLAR
jgi:subtilisin family serine protease